MTSNTNKPVVSGQSDSDVVLHGYLKKLKTMKNKYFVLYEECGKSLARLEYFDNEKKFKSKTSPKRTIILNSCFNINRCLDTKYDFVITLSTKDGSFGIVMETEEEMNTWLKAMLKLQGGQSIGSGPRRPYYEHVWQVIVQRKGLAEKKGILGNYHVCLSSKSVTLLRIGMERTNIGEVRVPFIEFFLTSIRSCGDSKCYFYMEVGRHSVTGAGELWMETKDAFTAQNMHTMILNVMSSNADDPYGPMRKRSSSATETSKPVTILQRRQTHSGSKTLNSSPLSAGNRDRCDSLPSSRNRTITESSSTSMPPSRTMSSLSTVPNSVYNRHSHSPPMNSNVLSPSAGCSESEGSTLSIDEPDSMKLTADESASCVSRFYNSRSPGGVIPEENSDEFWYAENRKQNASTLNKLNIHNLQPMDGGRKTTLSSSSNVHSDEGESQYMDMFNSISPCESAQCDTNLAGAECPFKNCNDSSGGNSRASSIAEDLVDGYVHMSPQTSDYVDMEQSYKSRRGVYPTSTHSVITGIMAKDISFEEYPLEKISSGIFPDEDEAQALNERPPRAYSVGSRMEHNNQKLRVDIIQNADQNNCRVRAFSVGSRSKVPRCDLQRNVLMTAATSCSSNNSNANNSKTSIASIEPISESAVRGRKSSSAPLLIHKSQNSVDRMDDLMEIDFSKNSSSRSNSLSSQSPGASSSYLTNLPKGSHLRSSALSSSPGNSSYNKSHDSFSEPIQIRASAAVDNGYLEMRPVMYSNSLGSNDGSVDQMSVPNDSSISESPELKRHPQPHQDATHNNKYKLEDSSKFETPEGYLEMSWAGNKDHSYVVHDQLNNRHLVNELAKSRSPYTLMEAKKPRGVSKMSTITACQSLNNNNRTTTTNNNSKLSMLHSQNQANQKVILAKTDCSQRKRFFDHVNSSFTISEEKTTGLEADQDTTMSEQFQNLSVQLPKRNVNDNSSDVHVNLSTADSDYVNFSPEILNEKSSEKETEKKIDDLVSQLNESNRSLEKSSSMYSKSESFDSQTKKRDSPPLDESGRLTRKSNSPKCTPTSRSKRFTNTNRQTKDTGYELLHIRSDSSLQTKKNISRPSSVNSDRIFPLDGTQSRPNSVNSDSLHTNSVSSSTLCHFASPKNCDNRIQDPLSALKPVPICNSAYIEDNKQKSTDSISSNKLMDGQNSPVSKLAALCQSSSNPGLELHYASLDLPISSTKNSNTTIYNPAARSSTSDDTPTSLSPNSNTSQQSAFTYAKIDFNQCENKKFKCATQNNL